MIDISGIDEPRQQRNRQTGPHSAERLPLLPQPRALSLQQALPIVIVAAADDDRRRRLTSAMAALPSAVSAVGDSAALIERLADALLDGRPEAAPRLLLVDVSLPGSQVSPLLELVRQLGWSTTLVLLTRRSDHSTRARAWDNGVAGVFIEPFDLGEVRAFCDLILDPRIGAAVRQARATRLQSVTRASC